MVILLPYLPCPTQREWSCKTYIRSCHFVLKSLQWLPADSKLKAKVPHRDLQGPAWLTTAPCPLQLHLPYTPCSLTLTLPQPHGSPGTYQAPAFSSAQVCLLQLGWPHCDSSLSLRPSPPLLQVSSICSIWSNAGGTVSPQWIFVEWISRRTPN